MVEDPKVANAGLPALKVLAVFAAAIVLQGASLAVFDGERPANTSDHSMQSDDWPGAIIVPAVYTVSNVADDGKGSFRQAIADANAHPGLDWIRFEVDEPLTLTLESPLMITDPVDIESSGPWMTAALPGFVTVDGSNVAGDVFVITSTHTISIRRLRVINASHGFGFRVLRSADTEFISNTVMNSAGGFSLEDVGHITVTKNALIDLQEAAVDAKGGEELLVNQNLIRNIGGTGVQLLDGVKNTLVISNTVNGVFEEFGAAFVVAGDPSPTDIVMRGNVFTDTYRPISLGTGANNGFSTPEIISAYLPSKLTNELQFAVRSTADPISFSYPLLMDVYRVRDGNYFPLGATVMYDESEAQNVITKTISLEPGTFGGSGDDYLAVIATTFGSSTSEFSVPVLLAPPPDEDDDGIADGSDLCPGTVIPEDDVPALHLGINRFALVDDDASFDTATPEGQGPRRSYTLVETAGCSCEQIIDELNLGKGQRNFGCSISAMDEWVAEVNSASKSDVGRSQTTATSYALDQNYPNPFNPATTITFQVPEQQRVLVRVFDMLGREVTRLIDEELTPGTYHVQWDGRNAGGHEVASGVYIYRIEAGDFAGAKTMILHR